MAEVIIMPKLGFNMDEGELVRWCKKEGEAVTKGETLFEINTDKTVMPVEATQDGVVLKILLEENNFAPVFTPIAVVGQPGDDVDAALAAYAQKQGGGAAPAAAEEAAPAPAEEAAPAPAVSTDDLKLTPRARTYIKDNDIDPASVAQIQGTGFEGGITQRDIKASPLARKKAEKLNVDLSGVQGSGVGGKIMSQDVTAPAAAPAAAADSPAKRIAKTTPYKGVRKVIGDRLAQSKFTSPHLYFTDEVDMSNLDPFRAQLNAVSDVKISTTDLFVKAAAKALKKFPEINVSLIDGSIVTYASANVGIAVAGDKGLIVPAVKEAQQKTIAEIAVETKDLIARAREGHLSPEEYSCGTFSISNLGMFGIGNFTAIINPPEAAILSISSTRKRAVVITEDGEDKIVIRPMMNIQLSVDHRLIDGLLASQFVEYMKQLLEDPMQILI